MEIAADRATAAREPHMRVALEMAARGMAAGGPPVGACLVKDGEVVARAHNSVIGSLDVTAHAEIEVIRQACTALRTLTLENCELYVSVQPCPMCLAAAHYAGIRTIAFGAPISAMHAITASELQVEPEVLLAGFPDGIELISGILLEECITILEQWGAASGRSNKR